MSGRYYVLVDREPIEVDMMTWATQTQARANADDDTDPWRVAFSEFDGGIVCSTVFLGLDHNHWGTGPPILFETMLLGDLPPDFDEYQTRCSTWDHALVMHREAVLWAVEHGLGEPRSSKLYGVL